MRFQNYLKDEATTTADIESLRGAVAKGQVDVIGPKTGVTSTDHGHSHGYQICPKTGDGETTDTREGDPHTHKITNFKVQSAHGHTHTIPKGNPHHGSKKKEY